MKTEGNLSMLEQVYDACMRNMKTTYF